MDWFGVEQGREEENVKDFPGPDWCSEMNGETPTWPCRAASFK